MACWFDPTLKLGDILVAVSPLAAAWWVGHVIQRRDSNDRAIKELMSTLCQDLLQSLATLKQAMETSAAGLPITEASRHSLMVSVTGFSNGIMTIEEAFKMWAVDGSKCSSFGDLKKSREDLRAGILDPLVALTTFDPAQIRQINGEITRTKVIVVKFQLEVIKTF